ncbi:uncharacterized protein LOC131043736 [Cryptomeria japonica]|uniref:uncharacterized protein LOC131043736 n=1 Tax=Cryptomeria japonica TaxID=3369 RepID=UPI0025AC8770|nr:uncharacterized protein LOC131043736 [Cryptomeria japonica]
MYKIITKVIAERLKPWLNNLISEEQGGFVTGQQILDGVIIAAEAMHSMAASKEKAMFIKLDMAKAYDRVRWSFLQKILQAFDLFGAARGLRQGDPLSPYLFILMAEGLGRLIKSQVSQGGIQGWKWGHDIPPSSHLQFVDDTSLMGAARIQEAASFRRDLDIYVKASG